MPSPRASPYVGVGPQRWLFSRSDRDRADVVWSDMDGGDASVARWSLEQRIFFCFFGLAKPDVNVVRYTEQ